MVNVNQNQLGSVTTIINYLVGYILQKYNRNMNDTGIILAVYVNLLINYIVLNPTILPTNFNAEDISSNYHTPLKNLIIWAKHLNLDSDEKRIAFKKKFIDETNAQIRNRWAINEITPEIRTLLDENAAKDLLEIIIKFHDRIAPNWPNINYRINSIQNRIDNIPNSEDIKLANNGWDFLVEMTLAERRRQDENRSSRLGGKKSRKIRKFRKSKKSRKTRK